MSNPKRPIITLCLMSVLTVTALAGEMQTPPCSPPDPGEIQSPPCATAQLATDAPTNPGETPTPATAEEVMISTIADAAIRALLSVF